MNVVATTRKLKSLRAVGRNGEGGYILRQKQNARPREFAAAVGKAKNQLEKDMTAASARAVRKGLSTKAIRQEVVGVLHAFYRKTAAQYGYEYLRKKG